MKYKAEQFIWIQGNIPQKNSLANAGLGTYLSILVAHLTFTLASVFLQTHVTEAGAGGEIF